MLRERKHSRSKMSKSPKYRTSDVTKKTTLSLYSYNKLIFALFCIGILTFAFLIFKFPATSSVYASEAHDLLIIFNDNGNIITMDENMATANAICIDITTGKFIYISKNQYKLHNKCLQIPHKTIKIVNASKYMILPGLIDTHAHIMMRGALLYDTIDISHAKSFKHMIKIIKDFININNIEKGSWIKSIGYDENKWIDWYSNNKPTRFDLDKYISDYKLLLYRIDLHAILINSLALNSIIDTFPSNTDNIAGGYIIKNNVGKLTGMFIDNAKKLITKHIHPYYGNISNTNKLNMLEILSNVIKECNKYGVTSIHDMDEKQYIIENVYKKLIDTHLSRFNLRLSVYVHGSYDGDDDYNINPNNYNKYFMYGNRLNVIGVKFFLDGSLGSHSAKLIDPYCDKPNENGIWRYNNVNGI
eukprot:82778_1